MKRFILPWMALLVSFSSWALDINAVLSNVRILAYHPGNIVVLSRGLEDDISIGTHARLSGAQGYVARAICVKVGSATSHWRLYRIVDTQKVSKDVTYSLVGMDDSETAPQTNKWQATDFETLPDYQEKASKPKPDPAIKSDMPESLSKIEEDYREKSLSERIMQRNLDSKRLKRDFNLLEGHAFISPWLQQQGGKTSTSNIGYGGKLSNAGRKYIGTAQFRRSQLTAKDGDTGERARFENTEAGLNFKILDFDEDTTAVSDVTFRQARYGRLATPHRQFLIAPIGLDWHYQPGKTLTQLTIGYSPTYDTRTHEILTDNDKLTTEDERILRHAFRWRSVFELNKHWHVTADADWRPAQDIGTWGLDLADNLSQVRLTNSFKFTESLALEFEYTWLDDAQLRRINSISRVVKTNALNLKAHF
jgi:hypothetical protein